MDTHKVTRTYPDEIWIEQILPQYVSGVHRHRLCEQWEISRHTLFKKARRFNMRKKDVPGAVSLRPLPPPYKGAAARARAFLIDPEDPIAGADAAMAAARRAAAEGRPEDCEKLTKASRALILEASTRARFARGARAPEAAPDPEPPGPEWRLQAHPGQRPPEPHEPGGDWRTWLFMGGRGAGKTRAGAEWLDAAARAKGGARLALVGPALHDVREVMVDGPSGLLRLPRPDRPRWEATRRRLVWPNDSVAYAFSAEDPESLRGPQHAAAWADEFCVWREAGDTLALLRMGLRLGERPRLVVTTTPRPIPALRRLIAEPGCVLSRAATAVNAEHLAPAFLEHLQALYGGTRLALQELDGVLVEAADGALWRAAELRRCHGRAPDRLERVVVAVDPPAASDGAACGIVVAGRAAGRGYVLADESAAGLSPHGWARRAAEAAERWGADRIVAEANQGGDMVKSVLAAAGTAREIELVRASRGKRARAEPVAALYEQGRVTHCAPLALLEEEMMALGGGDGGPSPDRADALVWALSALLLGEPEPAAPRVRGL